MRIHLCALTLYLSLIPLNAEVSALAPDQPKPISLRERWSRCAESLRAFQFKKALGHWVAKRSKLKELGEKHLFNGDPRPSSSILKSYITAIYNSRSSNPDDEAISLDHLNELLELIETTDRAIFDRKYAQDEYGKPAEEVTLFDAYLKLEEILAERHRQFLKDPDALIIDGRVLKAARITHRAFRVTGYALLGGIALGLGTTIANMAIESVTFGLKADTQKASFQARMAAMPRSQSGIQPSDAEREAFQRAANDLYIKYYGLYSWPEHEVIDRTSYLENQHVQTLILLGNPSTTPDVREAVLAAAYQWRVRYEDVFNSPMGEKVRTLWQTMWDKYDSDGSLRKKFQAQAEAPGTPSSLRSAAKK